MYLSRSMRLVVPATAGMLVLGNLQSSFAQDLQVNQPDVNLGNNDNSTTQSETNNAVSGSTVVVGWNDSRQVAAVGVGGLTSLHGFRLLPRRRRYFHRRRPVAGPCPRLPEPG